MNLAVLITCHNRKEKTLRCLESLYAQTLPADLRLRVWLVDDGSTDGTLEAVTKKFPEVSTVVGPGDLFWCGGMRLAWEHAAQEKPEAFLWLNDDVELESSALSILFAVSEAHRDAIVVGSCACPRTGRRTYGGKLRAGAHPGKLEVVNPGPATLSCDTFEGNIVWVPASVHAKIGILAEYRHAMGDIDYGYRAREAGFARIIAPGFLGKCSANSSDNTWEDARLPRSVRLKKLKSTKGLPPADWWRFCTRNGGVRAPLYFVGPFFRVLLGK